MANYLDLGQLSFYWRVSSSKDPHSNIPTKLPFKLSFDKQTQLIMQSSNNKTLKALKDVYSLNYNIGYLQESFSLLKPYCDSFFDFFNKYEADVKNKSILDVGCGEGYLLKLFKNKGSSVFGIDPSPFAKKAAEKYKIKVFNIFYDKNFKNKYDIVIHHNVLEHVEDPFLMINQNYENLNDEGRIFIAVPDCSDQIENGDLSMVWHEHISYFDKESLGNLLLQKGFKDVNVSKSNFGGLLYATGLKSSRTSIQQFDLNNNKKFSTFIEKHQKRLIKIKSYFNQVLSNPSNKLGIYIPLRMITYLNLMKVFDFKNIRFFDDDEGSYKKYYDGFPVIIENFEDLKNNPPNHLLISTYSFAEFLCKKIKNEVSEDIHLKLLSDFNN